MSTRYVWDKYSWDKTYVEHTDNEPNRGLVNYYVLSGQSSLLPGVVGAKDISWDSNSNTYAPSNTIKPILFSEFEDGDDKNIIRGYYVSALEYPYLVSESSSIRYVQHSSVDPYVNLIENSLQLYYSTPTSNTHPYWIIESTYYTKDDPSKYYTEVAGLSDTISLSGTRSGWRRVIRSIEYVQGEKIGNASSQDSGAYPQDGSKDGYYYKYLGSDSIDPTDLVYSKSSPVAQGSTLTASITPRTSTYGGDIQYQWKYTSSSSSSPVPADFIDDGSLSSSISHNYKVPTGIDYFRAGVRVSDTWGFESITVVKGSRLNVIEALPAYIGVNGKARQISKIYIGINGKAQEATGAFIGVNGKARTWF